MTLLTAAAAGFVLGVLILAFVTRSIIGTLLGAIGIAAAALLAAVVAIGNDVADVVAYLENPEKPVLVVLADGDEPIAAAEIRTARIKAIRQLTRGLNSSDPIERAQAEIDFRTDFAELIPAQHQGQRLTPGALHEIIDGAAHGLSDREMERLVGRVEAVGWDGLMDQAYRVVVLRMDYALELLEGEETVTVPVDLHGDTVEAEIEIAYLVDCLSAPDCGERLGRVAEQPSVLIRKLGSLENLDEVLEEYPELQQAVELHADYIPRTALANMLAAGLLYFAAVDSQPPSERATTVVEAMRRGGIDIYPRTAIPFLVNTAFELIPKSVVRSIASRAAV